MISSPEWAVQMAVRLSEDVPRFQRPIFLSNGFPVSCEIEIGGWSAGRGCSVSGQRITSLRRDATTTFCHPIRHIESDTTPGRCPGLTNFAPLGAEESPPYPGRCLSRSAIRSRDLIVPSSGGWRRGGQLGPTAILSFPLPFGASRSLPASDRRVDRRGR